MYIDDYQVDNLVGESIKRNLHLTTSWYGDPSSSSFGIIISLEWGGIQFGTTVIDYITKD